MGLRDRVKRKAKEVLGMERPATAEHAPEPRLRTEAAVPEPLLREVPAVEAPPAPAESPVRAEPPVEEAAPTEAPAPKSALSAADAGDEVVRARVVEALKTVYDPEIPVDIYELGLIYGIAVQADGVVDVTMTLTSPNCPAAQSLPAEVEQKAGAVEGASGARVEIVWDPPWGPERMSEAAQLELNLF